MATRAHIVKRNSITVLDTNSFTDYQENAEHLNPITEEGFASPR